jgi:two-component system, NtrC family, response regulator AtoC
VELNGADLGLREEEGKSIDVTTQALDGMTLEAAEKMLIVAALQATQNNVSEAARRLGVSRMTLRYRMEKYELASGE